MAKVMGILDKILAFFTMLAHQIWSCHMTQEANFEIFLFCPNYTFNIRKSHKISSGKALYFNIVNIGHAEARAENSHSGKMAHISINMCYNQNLQKAPCAQD